MVLKATTAYLVPYHTSKNDCFAHISCRPT